MNRDYLVQATLKLYQLTLLFPKKDPLRLKVRELGTVILEKGNLILEEEIHKSEDLILETQKDLDILDCFFKVVKELNWVKLSQLLDVREGYIKIEEEIRKISVEQKRQLELTGVKENQKESLLRPLHIEKETVFKIEESEEVSLGKDNHSSRTPFLDRKRKILGVLKEKGKVQVGDIKEVFPEVSKRTLRRDFRYLVDTGAVERKGEKNETFYQLKNNVQADRT